MQNLMIAIMRHKKQSLNLTITMEMQKRERSWMVAKKRKREKMQHTDCKAKLVVKLIADKWHVIYFALDHNHDLVIKPSLKKFLRSHKGIPKQEKDFIALLHGCNLSIGRIMQPRAKLE